MVTETSATGSHLERTRWMVETLAAVRQARAEAIPVLGYTWFPHVHHDRVEIPLVAQGAGASHAPPRPLGRHPREGRLDRDATPLVDTYRRFTTDPHTAIGDWVTPPPSPARPPGRLNLVDPPPCPPISPLARSVAFLAMRTQLPAPFHARRSRRRGAGPARRRNFLARGTACAHGEARGRA